MPLCNRAQSTTREHFRSRQSGRCQHSHAAGQPNGGNVRNTELSRYPIRKARSGNPETPEWAITASIGPDRHYFSGLCLSNDVLELSPETLEPIARANLRTGTAPAIFALPAGLVEVAAPGGGPGGGMEILYAGVAPDLAGVQQVNVRIHPSTPLRGLGALCSADPCRVRIGHNLRENSG